MRTPRSVSHNSFPGVVRLAHGPATRFPLRGAPPCAPCPQNSTKKKLLRLQYYNSTKEELSTKIQGPFKHLHSLRRSPSRRHPSGAPADQVSESDSVSKTISRPALSLPLRHASHFLSDPTRTSEDRKLLRLLRFRSSAITLILKPSLRYKDSRRLHHRRQKPGWTLRT